MLTLDQFRNAVDFAQGGSLFPDSPLHGDDHWRAVAAQGLMVCDLSNLGAQSRATAAIFGLFHDCRRENEHYDPEHGARAAQAVLEWADRKISLPTTFETNLLSSLVLHDNGQTTEVADIGIGWDADRSVLTRCGMDPDYSYFSVVSEPDFFKLVDAGYDTTDNPPSWDEIWDMAFKSTGTE